MRRSKRVATSREMPAARSIVLLRFAIESCRDIAMQQLCASDVVASNSAGTEGRENGRPSALQPKLVLASPAQAADRRELSYRAGKFTLGHRDVCFGGPVLQGLFREAFGLERLGLVQVASSNRRVRQHRHHIRLDFQKSTLDVDDLLFRLPRHLDADYPGLDLGNERRVPGINAELAHHAGKHDELRVAGIDRLFGADNIDVNGVGHWVPCKESYCSVFAFSTASSMPPIM